MSLCSVDDVKTLLGRTDTEEDQAISAMVDLASRWLAAHIGRVCSSSGTSLLEYFTDRVETLDAGESFVDLLGYPVVGDIVVVESSTLPGLDTATPLTANVDYRLEHSRVIRLTSGRDLGKPFAIVGGFVKVTYSGGWWAPDATGTMPDGWCAVPAAQRQAATVLARHLFQYKDHFGQRSIEVGTATISEVIRDLNVIGVINTVFDPLKISVGLG